MVEIIILVGWITKYKIDTRMAVNMLIMYALGILIPIFNSLQTIKIKPTCAKTTPAPRPIANPKTPNLPIKKNINENPKTACMIEVNK